MPGREKLAPRIDRDRPQQPGRGADSKSNDAAEKNRRGLSESQILQARGLADSRVGADVIADFFSHGNGPDNIPYGEAGHPNQLLSDEEWNAYRPQPVDDGPSLPDVANDTRERAFTEPVETAALPEEPGYSTTPYRGPVINQDRTGESYRGPTVPEDRTGQRYEGPALVDNSAVGRGREAQPTTPDDDPTESWAQERDRLMRAFGAILMTEGEANGAKSIGQYLEAGGDVRIALEARERLQNGFTYTAATEHIVTALKQQGRTEEAIQVIDGMNSPSWKARMKEGLSTDEDPTMPLQRRVRARHVD